MARKGMGKGTGKGYKNMIGVDSKIHSLSAKGIKQPNQVNDLIKNSNKPKLSSEEEDAMSSLGGMEFYKLKSFLKSEFDSTITNFREEEDGVYMIELKSGEEFYLFEDDDKAERFAIDRVRDDLDDEPENFSKDWLNNHIYITDTDRRIIAQEESDNIVDEQADEREMLENAGFEDDYDKLQELIDEKEEKVDDMEDKGIDDVLIQETRDKIQEFETEKDELVEKAKEDYREMKYDEIYKALEDPMDYFVNEQGIYTEEELIKQSFISIDTDEASQDAVNTDGWQHFIATYDGNSLEVPDSKMVLARTN